MGESEVVDELRRHEGFLLCPQISSLVEESGVSRKVVERVLTQLSRVNALDIIETPRGRLYRLKDNVRYRLERQDGKG